MIEDPFVLMAIGSVVWAPVWLVIGYLFGLASGRPTIVTESEDPTWGDR